MPKGRPAMPASKPVTAAAVHANRGIEARYRRRLEQLIAEMAASYERWIPAAYRQEPPAMEVLASDATPSTRTNQRLGELGRRWEARFNEMSDRIAREFVTSMFKTSQQAMRASLAKAGWAVQFTMTPAVRDAFEASIAENVALIKSIPAKYHEQVEGIVNRSYTAGRDLSKMTKDLRSRYRVTKDRAVLISRDQSNKANAVVNRARQLELGITEAIWMHSHAGKEPRKSHVAANGKRYKIARGCKIDGEYIQPGELINCRCTSRPVLPI